MWILTGKFNKFSELKLAWPIFISSILSMSLGYVDTYMLTGYSEEAVAAISNANSVMSMLTLAFTVVSSATGILTAQYLGAKRTDKLNQVYTVSMLFNFCLSLFVGTLLVVFNKNFLAFLNTPESLVKDASTYIIIVGSMIFAHSIFSTFDQIFRSNGKTKIGMVLAFAMSIINIIGDYSVVYGPLKQYNFGVAGVAVATVLSRLAMVIVAIIYFKCKIEGKISFKFLKPFPINILKQLLKLGIPTAGEKISYTFSQTVIMSIVNTIAVASAMGTAVINTRAYCDMICMVAYVFTMSLGIGTEIVVGHSVGAKNYDYAYKRVLKMLSVGMVISMSLAVVNFFISDYTLGLFTNNIEILKLGKKVMFVAMFLELGRTVNLIVINAMKASGDVKFPTTIGIISMWGIAVLMAYVLGVVFGLGLVGVWIAMAMDEIFRGIIVLIRWKKGTWKNKRIVED